VWKNSSRCPIRANPPTGVVDANVVSKALADADAEINSYVAVRYKVPLVPIPPRVEKLACDIARKYLFKDAPLEEVADNYKAAVASLRDISKGVAELDADGLEPVGDTTGSPQLSRGPPLFNNDTMGGF